MTQPFLVYHRRERPPRVDTGPRYLCQPRTQTVPVWLGVIAGLGLLMLGFAFPAIRGDGRAVRVPDLVMAALLVAAGGGGLFVLTRYCRLWLIGNDVGLYTRRLWRRQALPWRDVTTMSVRGASAWGRSVRVYHVATAHEAVSFPSTWRGAAELAGWIARTTGRPWGETLPMTAQH